VLEEPVAVLAKEDKQEFDQAIIVTHEDPIEFCGVKSLQLKSD
jgi:hypothetical protein